MKIKVLVGAGGARAFFEQDLSTEADAQKLASSFFPEPIDSQFNIKSTPIVARSIIEGCARLGIAQDGKCGLKRFHGNLELETDQLLAMFHEHGIDIKCVRKSVSEQDFARIHTFCGQMVTLILNQAIASQQQAERALQ